jgi:hypothetical protein
VMAKPAARFLKRQSPQLRALLSGASGFRDVAAGRV